MSRRHPLPIFVENSRVPRWLSVVAPITIRAIALGPLVFVRDRADVFLVNHERIHWRQQVETLFVGFLVIYLMHYLVNLARYRDGRKAYREIVFEREAYAKDSDLHYLANRPRFAWIRYWGRDD